jgi:beta-N-acetylhexosaminidase
MIGLNNGSSAGADDAEISGQHVGNIIYLGGWNGSARIRATSNHLQSQVNSKSTAAVPLLIAADQEGGEVQQLRGAGFTRLESALQQGSMTPAQRTAYGRTIGSELKAAGVNLNLAPVADTVPTSIGKTNAPIGRWDREFGHFPGPVAKAVSDVVRGIRGSGIGATVKHFPGLGRITGNTDYTTTGTTDTRTTSDDAFLQPFAAGIRAGTSAVMVSSARYARIDDANRAPFSSKVISGMLRGSLGWRGVVITDDMNAAAVSGIPAGERAVRFVAAGGDIVLTGRAADVGAMTGALLEEISSSKGFAAKAAASTIRVLTMKQSLGLLKC